MKGRFLPYIMLLTGTFFALTVLFTGSPAAQAAGLFEKKQAGPSIFIGEVQSYGDYELKADACATFVDKLSEALQKQGFGVSGRADLTNEAGRHDAIGAGGEAGKLSEIHMDAIVHGHQFDRGYTAAKLAHYADAAMGRAYFHQEDRIAAWKKSTAPYRLSPAEQQEAARIGQEYQAGYLLFVNLKDFDVRLKHSIFATHTERETKGKKLSASLDYYLINAQTGKTYEGHVENKKTAQMVNFGLGKTGKGMDVDTLLGEVMETSAKDVASDIKKHGFREVEVKGNEQASFTH
ncbi:MAG: hypothetical protein ACI4OH_03295 [Mitsuokella sp.]|uniref:hypothetical protein n=1 Tax=Mitsuokella sp. TaxID=2049034 RepID=UPI003F0177CB